MSKKIESGISEDDILKILNGKSQGTEDFPKCPYEIIGYCAGEINGPKCPRDSTGCSDYKEELK
ncbi:MAG: hypothetical protein Q8N99_05190 [Nanoarchaeota archaeon]|nr:hypothetical protein [Nanoarchaeota archaeon]